MDVGKGPGKGISNNPAGKPVGTKNKDTGKMTVSHAFHLVNDLIGTFKSGKFYVYKHIVNQEVVYIGKGIGSRAWQKSSRAAHHKDIIDECEVRIIASDLREDEALAIERVLIMLNNPKYNIIYNDSK